MFYSFKAAVKTNVKEVQPTEKYHLTWQVPAHSFKTQFTAANDKRFSVNYLLQE